MKALVLVGGGHAQVQVLRAMAPSPFPGARVTLVSPFARLVYSGMVPGVVAGHCTLDECSIPLGPLAARAGVAFVEGVATAIDPAARRLTLADGQCLHYDTLSLDTGAVMDRAAIPGAREHALFVRPIEHFVPLWQRMLALADARPLDVVVVGAGAAGVELAMAVQFRLGTRSRVSLVTGGPPPLASHPPRAQRLAQHALKRCGVTVFDDVCSEITASHVVLARGMRLACDAPLLALGTCAPGWLRGSGLALDERGFIATGATLQSTSHPEVFAVGDVASRIDRPGLPRNGVYAVRAGPPLALNLRRHLGGGTLEPHRPQTHALSLLSCGERRAIASWAGVAFAGRWVWRWKDRIDRRFVADFR